MLENGSADKFREEEDDTSSFCFNLRKFKNKEKSNWKMKRII